MREIWQQIWVLIKTMIFTMLVSIVLIWASLCLLAYFSLRNG